MFHHFIHATHLRVGDKMQSCRAGLVKHISHIPIPAQLTFLSLAVLNPPRCSASDTLPPRSRRASADVEASSYRYTSTPRPAARIAAVLASERQRLAMGEASECGSVRELPASMGLSGRPTTRPPRPKSTHICSSGA